MTLPVVVIGLSHKTAPVEVRERFASGPDVLPEVLARLTARKEIDEAMFLSTCNRVEVIGLPKIAGSHEESVQRASRAIREAMTSMLGREGWIVDVAEDGARALQMTRQLRYDLVVTDLEMPELGGFDLIARLRKDDRFKTTPIVIITSRANPEHRRRARDLGVRALVAKPITRRKLLEALAAR